MTTLRVAADDVRALPPIPALRLASCCARAAHSSATGRAGRLSQVVAAAVAVAAATAGELPFQRLENITVYRFYVENVYAEARYAVTGMSGSLAHHIGPVCTELWMFAPFTNLLM